MRRRGVWDSYWVRLIGASTMLLGILPFILQRAHVTKDYGEALLVGTGVAIIWYTVETFYLRQAMVRANEIAVLPLIIAAIEAVEVSGAVGQNYKKSLVLRNIGKGPALFVRVEDLQLANPELKVKFEAVDVIEEKQKAAAQSQPYFGEAKVLNSFLVS
jgi:hypothetical protein